MNTYFFSYGTLQKEDVQLALFGRKLKGTKDVLNGYKAAFIEIQDEKFLSTGEEKLQRIAIPSLGATDCIQGTVFQLSEEELLHADQYEPSDYKRIKVTLASGIESWVYASIQ